MVKNNFKTYPKWLKITFQLIFDILSIIIAYFGSLLLRFGAKVPESNITTFLETIIPVILIYLLCFKLFGLYKSLWETASIDELIKVCLSSICGAIAVALLMALIGQNYPISVHFAGFGITMVLAGYTRLAYRVIRRIRHRFCAADMKKAMIIGAGDMADSVIRQLQENQTSGFCPAVIIDDDRNKRNTFIRGIKVAGNRYDIARLATECKIDVIVFCIPSATPKDKKDILNICAKTACEVKTVPGLDEIFTSGQLVPFRKIEMTDLLTRPEITADDATIRDYITDRTILVTGGGGSFGSELCRQIALFHPAKLVIFDIYENTTYELQMQLEKRYPLLKIMVEIGSVRDEKRLDDIFSRYKPDVVFHAAAHKHVPLMENSPAEAVKNNVYGTLNTARAADRYGVKRFVLISTDKAVHPSSVMGATKRMAEHVIQYMNSFSKTQFVAVRFGNVLGSHGSVIPLFRKQIEEGGPVTVTHKDITRFFMTIPEASRLVLQAGNLAHKGEIFILDMGEPVRIDDMARTLIRLSGYEPDVDIQVVYTGLRPGEKLYEELFLDEEMTEKTEAGGIMVGRAHHPAPEVTRDNLDWLRDQIDAGADVRACLQKILPTYHPLLNVPDSSDDDILYEAAAAPEDAMPAMTGYACRQPL
jgi:FlaA1/EpsC-like NDP-sugar epimerase